MARQGLFDDSGVDFECSNADVCQENAYKQGYADARAEVISEVEKILPQIYCNNCNQIACDGGRAGSIQECASVRLLIDTISELEEELKE